MQSAGSDGETLFDLLSVGIVQTDEEWKFVYANAAAQGMLGQPAAEVDWSAIVAGPAEIERQGRCLTVTLRVQPNRLRLIELHDVTARKRAESALEANQEFLQAVLDSADSSIVACDGNGKLRLFNDAARRLHGIPEEPVPPDEWAARYDLYYPDGSTRLKKEDVPLYRAYSGNEVRRQEILIAPATAQPRAVLCTGRPLYTRSGRKLGAVIAMSDITHRKVSSRRIRQSMRQFRDLFNHAPVAYHEIDRHGNIRRVNMAELRLLERSRTEMLGRPVWEFVSEHERESSRIAVSEKLAGTRPLRPFSREYVTPSGRRVAVEVHESLIKDSAGVINGIRTALLDVTDRVQRESQSLALSREIAAREQAELDSAEIRSILERIGDAYIAFDTEWRYTYVNHRAAELALKPASELIGRCVWDEFPDAVKTSFYTELLRSMREQIPIEFNNYFAPLGKWFQNSVYPSPSGVGVFYRDITEQVRTDEALKKQTSAIARKNAELETFAYVVSHDLQEPLRMIGGYADLLTKRYAPALDADAEEFLGYINTGVKRMQNLIKDLLALSKLDKGQVRLDDVPIMDAVEHACANLDLTVAECHATIDADNLPAIRFNETYLVQIFQNLIGNALKYRREVPPHILIDAERYESGWTIAVTDNGIGFDMQFAEQVFRPFRRLHRRDDGGTGIGLAICKKIVQARGGSIWVQSQPGTGSTFYFSVPDEVPSAED